MTDSQQPYFDSFAKSAPEYTEQVLWHRVFLVAGIGIVALVVITWLSLTLIEPKPPSASFPNNTTEVNQPPVPDTGNNGPVISGAIKRQPSRAVENTTTEVTHNTNEPSATEPELIQPRAEADTAAAISPIKTETDYAVTVEVLTDDITDAALTSDMAGLEPAFALTSTEQLTNSFLKLFFFTDIRNRAGDVLTYSWFHNDEPIVRVKIPVRSNRWRNHSSKNIIASMRGAWRVEVTDKAGNLLAQSRFIVPPVNP